MDNRKGISKAEFNKVVHSKEVKEDVSNAIYLTEEYGVFTFLMWLWAENMFSPRVRCITMIMA